MKRLFCIICFLFVVATSQASKDTSIVKLDNAEFLFVELTDDDGNTIFRNYKKEGYIDLIITQEYHVNGKVHFYSPNNIDSYRIAFIPGGGDPVEKDWVLKLSGNNVKPSLVNGESEFGIMDANTFLKVGKKYKEFCLLLIFEENGKIKGNDITIGE